MGLGVETIKEDDESNELQTVWSYPDPLTIYCLLTRLDQYSSQSQQMNFVVEASERET